MYTDLVFLLLVLVFLAFASQALLIAFSIAPWVPTRKGDLERVNKLAKLKGGEVFCELGCGDGRVCSYIAAKNPGAKVLGIERSWLFYLLSRLRQRLRPMKNLEIKLGDAFGQGLSNADVVYFYGLPSSLRKLKPKLEKELKPRARFISYVFALDEWNGRVSEDRPSKKVRPMFLYEVGKK